MDSWTGSATTCPSRHNVVVIPPLSPAGESAGVRELISSEVHRNRSCVRTAHPTTLANHHIRNKGMNSERRFFLLSGGLGVAAILSGCTARLFADHQYTETVSSVLISQDNKKIAVIGNEYHYVFDAPDVLIRTLTSSFHRSVKGDFSTRFFVNSSGAISGNYYLTLGKNAPEQEKDEAIAVGFVKLSRGDLAFSGTLSGIRYSSGGIQASVNSQRLNRVYKINVVAEQTAGEKAAKSLLTPVTVTADGLLVIAMIPLFSAYVLATILMCHPHC